MAIPSPKYNIRDKPEPENSKPVQALVLLVASGLLHSLKFFLEQASLA